MNVFQNLLARIKGNSNKQTLTEESFAGVSLNIQMGEDSKVPSSPVWYGQAPWGVPRGEDINKIRTFAKSNWIRMVTQTIVREVTNIKSDVVAADEETIDEFKEQINEQTEKVKAFLNKPNRTSESHRELLIPTIFDVLEIDSGANVKVFSEQSYEPAVDQLSGYHYLKLKPFGQRELVELYHADGSTFLPRFKSRSRILDLWFQYSYSNPSAAPTVYSSDEVIYFVQNLNSYSLYGWSPLQSILQIVELMTFATKHNKDFFEKSAIPSMIIQAKGNLEQLKRLRDDFYAQFKGPSNTHKVYFSNGEATPSPLNISNKEMQWLEGMREYRKTIFAAYGLSPVEAGFHEDANRSSQAGQERISVKNAIKPYLELIENKINRELIPEILQVEIPLVKFKFFPTDHVEEEVEFNQDTKLMEIGAITINEFRKKNGLDPVEWGNSPLGQAGIAMNPDLQPNQNGGKPKPAEDEGETEKPNDIKDEEDNVKSFLKVNKQDEIDEIIKASKSYDDFISRIVKSWEKRVVNSAKSNFGEKSFNKTFGSFLATMFNAINTFKFFYGIGQIISRDMKKGIKQAEAEMKIDVGFDETFEQKSEKLVKEQIEGYTMYDGHHWHGLQGMTKELQMEIIAEVEEGLSNKEGREAIAERVRGRFDKFSESKSMMIARTETNRIINESKVLSYQKAGLKGAKKVWASRLDDRTTDICKRLNGMKVDVDKPFLDPETKVAYMSPPHGPNCRSAVQYSLD